MGLRGSLNCCTWQPAQGAWPSERTGAVAFVSRRWQSRQGRRECIGLVCENFEKSPAGCCAGSDEDGKLAPASCALTSVAAVASPLLIFEGAAREPSETFIRTTSAAAKRAASWAARRARTRRDSRSPRGPRAPWDSSAAHVARSGCRGASRRSFVTASGVSLIALSVLLRGRRWRGQREDVRFGERLRAVQDVTL